MASEYVSNPIPHRKWVLDTVEDMAECAEQMMTVHGMNAATLRWFANTSDDPASIEMRGPVVRTLFIQKDPTDRRSSIEPYLGHIVVLVDVINALHVYTPDEYAATMGGAQ
jgi:hypothetical protein